VQLEDKLVEGREAARVESQERADVLEHGEETLPAPVTEAMHDAALERKSQLLGAIRMILDRETLAVSRLRLPQRESHALEALQVAVSGKSTSLGQFVYASDRRDMLEQALAVLQPDMIHADDKTARELSAQFADLVHRVAELRHTLTDLEDAQDELLESHQKATLEQGTADPGDKADKPKPKPSDPDAPRPPTTLTGPDRPEPAKSPTTLTGTDRPEPAKPPTTLTGPELPLTSSPASTLTGTDRPEPAKPPTTLTGDGGPDRPEPAKPPTTLTGDAGLELAPDAPASPPDDADGTSPKPKRPWWRRPFG